jgi:tetratricopeptide (TPR) repeat protein
LLLSRDCKGAVPTIQTPALNRARKQADISTALFVTRRLSALLILCVGLAFSQTPTPEQLFREAVEAQRRGDDATAITKYTELLKLRPDVVEVRANLGAALAHQGRLDDAIEQYTAALARSPENLGVRFNLAIAYYKKPDWAKATEQLEVLHATQPADPKIATLLGDSYVRLHRNKDAIALLMPIETAHPDDLAVKWTLGTVLLYDNQPREGMKRIEVVAEQGKSAEAHLLAGQTALAMSEFERAQRHADAAILLNPKLPGVYTLQGQALQYLGDHPGASVALQKALDQNPNDFDAHLTLGAILNSSRDLDGARKHMDRAVQLRPDSALARFELAKIERTQGQTDAALKDFEQVVKEEPDWLQPHIELAALYYKVKRPEDGQRERAIVDRLIAEQNQRKQAPAPISQAPSQ